MIKGFYSAVTSMVTNSNLQELLAHNAANIDTPGFKQVLGTVEQFWQTPVVFPPGNLQNLSQMTYTGLLGLGSQSAPQVTDFTQGAMQLTGNMFDVGIEGEGYFRIETPDGERYTRDGRFLRDAEGLLVTVDGHYVLDENGNQITMPNGDITIDQNGNVMAGGAALATIDLVFFEDPQAALTPDQGNLFTTEEQPVADGTVRMLQGYLEMSNVNPTQLMTQLVEVARSYEAAQKMVQNQDELLGKAISTLGRIG
jgi:flagellar basal body rod protein FlgG